MPAWNGKIMDFAYSEEQRMLTDSLRRLMADAWTYDKRRARQKEGKLSPQAWASLSELGVAGLMVPQDFGGFGESPATMLTVHFELGRGVVSEPAISSAVMGVAILSHCANDVLKGHWLPAHAEGEAVLAVAWQEEGERYSTRPLCTKAVSNTDGFSIEGRKVLVWHGAGADALIVTAMMDGEMALFLVPRDAEGLSIADYPTMDGARCATVTLEHVRVGADALIAKGRAANELFDLAFDYGLTALCAHACGAMEYLIEATIQYLKTRKQFGQPLANFQVLQHRLADMLAHKEMALSMTYVAATALSEKDAARRSHLASMAKVEVAEAARFVGENAVQLHGGMGVTDELEVGDYFKRLTYTDLLLGDTYYHLNRVQNLAA